MISQDELNTIILRALREDAARNDSTTNILISKSHRAKGLIVVQEDAIICGLDIAKRVFKKLNPRVQFLTKFKDGAKVKNHAIIATVQGPTRALLAGERTALNFLGYLSAIATNTGNYVQKVQRSKVKILDTRKTTPGLRALEKYAVRCGGGVNHRFNLSEHILIKDNHRAACRLQRSIPQLIARVRRTTKKVLEVEVDNLTQFKQALNGGSDVILLDNMSCLQMRKAVELVKKLPIKKRPLLEASGGITLRNVAAISQTGVDRISIGALTHSHRAVNLSMELVC